MQIFWWGCHFLKNFPNTRTAASFTNGAWRSGVNATRLIIRRPRRRLGQCEELKRRAYHCLPNQVMRVVLA